jgi:hypothetical protein
MGTVIQVVNVVGKTLVVKGGEAERNVRISNFIVCDLKTIVDFSNFVSTLETQHENKHMIQAIVTPLQEDFDMAVTLPADYIGKKVHVLFYTDDEIKQTNAAILPKKKPSDFFGILSAEEGEMFDRHIQQMRTEWNRYF